MRNVYYAPLVRWERVEEIIMLVPEDERDEAEKLVISSIDHVVIETVLIHLDKEHHDEFMKKIHDAYHDPSVLDWLKEKVGDIEEKLKNAISQTKSSIIQLLS